MSTDTDLDYWTARTYQAEKERDHARARLQAVEKIVTETLRADAEDPEQYPTFNAGYVTAMENIHDALDGHTRKV